MRADRVLRRSAVKALLTLLAVPACDAGGAIESCVGTCGATPVNDGVCSAVEEARPIESATHVCSAVSYQSNPPSSGNHYPIWAAYKVYDSPVPAGFFVHDLEHGAVALMYNCPDGCPAEVAAAKALLDSFPDDALCGPAARHRLLLFPNPSLDVRFAAASWGYALRASCFDTAVFRALADAHYGHGRETTCADGVDVQAGTAPCP